jgi:hypothetical protein
MSFRVHHDEAPNQGHSKMNYDNYERCIVEHYKIELHGWPLPGCVRNPSKVGGVAVLNKLLQALKDNTCRWVKLSKEELAACIAHNKECEA